MHLRKQTYVASSGPRVSDLGPFGALVFLFFNWCMKIFWWTEKDSYKMYDSLIPEIKHENDPW